jgi:hypothetical protein
MIVIECRRYRRIKEELKRDKRMSVRLPRGSGLCRMDVVRGRETKGVKESESERSEAVRAGRVMIGTRVDFVLCRSLEGFCCRARGGSKEDEQVAPRTLTSHIIVQLLYHQPITYPPHV